MRPRVAAVVAAALVTAFALADQGSASPPGGGGAPVSLGVSVRSIGCPSPALGRRLPAMVYLPAGYSPSGAPSPVIYYLHGLPSGPRAYRGFGYLATVLNKLGRSAILVIPQASPSPGSDDEYLDLSTHRDWPRAIARDLTHCIDSRYNTIAERTGRALMGVSAGGYGALNIGLRHLGIFAVVESWSGYFAATDPTGTHVLKLGSASANRDARVPSGTQLQRALTQWPSLIGFFVGRSDPDLYGLNQRFAAALTAHGIPHVFASYPGGHTHSLWAREAPAWLSIALNYLAGSSGTPR